MKNFIFMISILIFSTVMPALASANSFVAESSAELILPISTNPDSRVIILKNFFLKNGSPLAEYADVFIRSADEYGLDWRFLPAITGVESTFGKKIPYESYNSYGWANGEFRFGSWEESIEIVVKTLREKYVDRGAVTIEEIAIRYAPPSLTWAGKVKSIMRKISPLAVDHDL